MVNSKLNLIILLALASVTNSAPVLANNTPLGSLTNLLTPGTNPNPSTNPDNQVKTIAQADENEPEKVAPSVEEAPKSNLPEPRVSPPGPNPQTPSPSSTNINIVNDVAVSNCGGKGRKGKDCHKPHPHHRYSHYPKYGKKYGRDPYHEGNRPWPHHHFHNDGLGPHDPVPIDTFGNDDNDMQNVESDLDEIDT